MRQCNVLPKPKFSSNLKDCLLCQNNGPHTFIVIRIKYVSNFVYHKMLATLCLVSSLLKKLSSLKYKNLRITGYKHFSSFSYSHPLPFPLPRPLLKFRIVENIWIAWEGNIFCFKIVNLTDNELLLFPCHKLIYKRKTFDVSMVFITWGTRTLNLLLCHECLKCKTILLFLLLIYNNPCCTRWI